MEFSEKKVLFICNYKPNVGGISGQVDILCKRLKEEGYNTSIFSTKGSIVYRLLMFPRLLKACASCDILHIHACSWWGFVPAVAGVVAGRIMKKRTVLTYHGGDAAAFFRKYPKMVKTVLEKTNCNIVLSGFIENVFHDLGIPCVVIPNVLEFKGDVFRARDTILPKFISIRAHTLTYNVGCILSAFSKVVDLHPDATLLVLGDGELHDALVGFVNDENIPNVSFIGRVDNSNIYHYLDNADIMLSSPLVDNMPVSILEAFNAGLLVISSRVGGVPYMMREGVDGLMFTSCDSDDLASKMIEAITNQEQSNSMIVSSHSSLDRYKWENVRNQLISVYE